MVNMTMAIPKELHATMKKHPEIFKVKYAKPETAETPA